MTPELFQSLVAEASHAPSVHNVQPARWRQSGGHVLLFEDMSRRLPAADPTGFDAGISLGAALEGFAMAATARGYAVTPEVSPAPAAPAQETDHVLRAVLKLSQGATADRLQPHLSRRASWRGAFEPPQASDKVALREAGFDACTLATDPALIARIARWNDHASMVFQRAPGFRAELLSWMRLKRSHPAWERDGLNAQALHLSQPEAMAAGVVLGPGFLLLDRLRMAGGLLSDAATTRGACAIAVLHVDNTQDPIACGRIFHREWLRIEAAGFGAAVLAALADHPTTSEKLRTALDIPAHHRIVSAFRIGRRPENCIMAPRARLGLDELII